MSTATIDLHDVEREHPADPSGEHAPAGGSFLALRGEDPAPLHPASATVTDSAGLPPSGLLETGTLPRLVDRALAPLQRRRLSAWIAGVPEQVSAIPAQRHRMKLVAFVALWALALAVVIPLVVQGLFSTFELELDLSTPDETVEAPAPVVDDVLEQS
ncbi:MAG: hypothetical protein KY469_05905 [Actinobacteria bacterium]|nr:hypothetical protein [Actinomycetota bacterium]